MHLQSFSWQTYKKVRLKKQADGCCSRNMLWKGHLTFLPLNQRHAKSISSHLLLFIWPQVCCRMWRWSWPEHSEFNSGRSHSWSSASWGPRRPPSGGGVGSSDASYMCEDSEPGWHFGDPRNWYALDMISIRYANPHHGIRSYTFPESLLTLRFLDTRNRTYAIFQTRTHVVINAVED